MAKPAQVGGKDLAMYGTVRFIAVTAATRAKRRIEFGAESVKLPLITAKEQR
jgi:hypothetical protein